MNQITKENIIGAIQTAIGLYSNVEPEDVGQNDHLVDDLYLELERDLPKVFAQIEKELELSLEPDTISDFITLASEDPDKATVFELIQLISEEVEYN